MHPFHEFPNPNTFVHSRKPCSGPKLKEMTGSGIFAANGEDGADESVDSFATPNGRPGLRLYQVIN